MIVHPDIDAEQITKWLGLSPLQCSSKGAARKTPIGTPLSGTYPDTRWTLDFPNLENRSIEQVMVEAVDNLPVDSSFWSELADAGGKAHLILSVVGTKYQGSSLQSGLVRKLAKMGIDLGLEIYAVPQNG